MLVLERKVGEKIRIGDGIVITVVEVTREVVRVEIGSDRGIKIEYGPTRESPYKKDEEQ